MRSAWLLLIAAASGCAAATFQVDDPGAAVDPSPGDGACATAAATCSLRAALEEATALGGVTRIELMTEGLAQEMPRITSEIVIVGPPARATIVGGPTRFEIAPGGNLTFDHVTLTGFGSWGPFGPDANGRVQGEGVARCDGGSLTLRDCVVTACTSGNDSPRTYGAIIESSSGSLTLVRSRFGTLLGSAVRVTGGMATIEDCSLEYVNGACVGVVGPAEVAVARTRMHRSYMDWGQIGGLALTHVTFADEAGAWYFLVAARSAAGTSSLGHDSFGTERPPATPPCR